MTTRWEYLMIVWEYNTKRLPGPTDVKAKWAYKKDFYIWRPGAAEADHRPAWNSEDKSVSGPNVITLLNELGDEGWELIGETVAESTIGTIRSWPDSGTPIRREWTLKRPIASAAP